MNLPGHVQILQSHLFETNTGIVETPEGALLIDPGISPSELKRAAESAGPVAAGFCTHAHWDHMLWHAALGRDTPRYASVETVAYMQASRERILTRFDAVEAEAGAGPLWDRDLFFREQPMPWGHGRLAGLDVELIPVRGHISGQAALLIPEFRVLFVADTLSNIEVPSFSGINALRDYQASLDRLQNAIDRVDVIVPGHGAVADHTEAQSRLDADQRYLAMLADAVNAQSVHMDNEELAYLLLSDLNEDRATADLSWDMHLQNIVDLRAEGVAADESSERVSSRLLLLNAANEVWMLRINDPVHPRWILPGGGVEAGESMEQAAQREMWEECGIQDVPVGPLVAERKAIARFNEVPVRVHEHYFLARVGEHTPHGGNMLDHEVVDYTEQRWFSADDIRTSTESVFPIGLAPLLEEIARGQLPDAPIVFTN